VWAISEDAFFSVTELVIQLQKAPAKEIQQAPRSALSVEDLAFYQLDVKTTNLAI